MRNIFALLFLIASHGFPVAAEVIDLDSKSSVANKLNLISQAQSYKGRLSTNTKTLSLEECIQNALKNNPDIASNLNLIKSLEWSVISERRNWLPTFNVDSTAYGNTNTDVYKSDNSTTSNSIYTNPSLNVTWTFLRPDLPASIDSDIALLKAQRFTYDYTIRTLVLQVQTSYVNLQANLALVNAYEKIYENNQKQVDYLTAQVDKGLATIGELAQSETTMYQQLGDLVSYQTNYLEAAADMAQLIGYKDDTLIFPDSNLSKKGRWDLSLVESVANALDAREEIKKYLQTAESNRWSARSLLKKYLPSLYLTLTSSYNGSSGCSSIAWGSGCFGDNKLITTQVDGQVYLGLNWQFDGGVNAADANALKAQEESNLSLAENERTNVAEQVKTSYNQYLSSQIEIELAKKQLEQARLNLEVSRERLIVGIGDLTTVVQAQQLLASAVVAQVTAIQQYNLSVAQLYRASAIFPSNIPSKILVSE
tara:strand:+ start:2108 stop:3550 length:1443 start_codon:yes stop_codon:yes gene_type:complete